MISLYFILCLAVILNAMANIFAKIGMNKIGQVESFFTLFPKIVRSPIIILALAFFGLNFALYTLALSRINLSIAYPIMVGLGYAIIVLTSGLFLKEAITLVQMIGIFLILIGIILIGK